jgi:alpha-galactosidase
VEKGFCGSGIFGSNVYGDLHNRLGGKPMRPSLFTLSLVYAVVMAFSLEGRAVNASQDEMNDAHEWSNARIQGGEPYFSFSYDGKKSSDFLSSWKVERSEKKIENGATERIITYSDPNGGLSVRCVATEFADFPVTEWILYFRNLGTSDTPIIEEILPLNAGFAQLRDKGARVRYANGSECRLDDFAPFTTSLGPNEHDPQGAWRGEGNQFRIESKLGRSSCGALPFFNLDMDDHGVIMAVGWTGEWFASFYRTNAEARVSSGMKVTHLKLLPGEEIRTPKIMTLFWRGEQLHGQNLLRRFILAHHTPTVDGKPAQAPVCNATWGGNYAAKHLEQGMWWKKNNLPLDYYWIDAGWYGADEAKVGANVFNSHWGDFAGDWSPNPGYFPEGLKAVSEPLKEAGMGVLLWLEIERVYKDTAWAKEHSDYMLGPRGNNYLYNLGNPEACKFLTDFLAKLIEENGVSCYRQDFNMDPRPYWDAADAPDRVGMAEIRHITGMYQMWDELRSRFPHLLIDNCSSGGRRIDLETISRSIPLWRSDVQCWPNYGATAIQGQNQGLGLWVPLSTGCCDRADDYVFRSAFGPGMVIAMSEFEKDTSKAFPVEWLRKNLEQLNLARPYFLGDFYPLLSFSLVDDSWSAWQYDRPENKDGMILALRRPESPFVLMTPALHELLPDAMYELRDADSGDVIRRSGAALMKDGIELRIDAKPGSKLLFYKEL